MNAQSLLLANILAVLAFKNTSVLSALVISSWTLPCIMLLSMCCLGYRYYAAHFGGVILCLIGLFTLIWTDATNDRTTNSKGQSMLSLQAKSLTCQV